MSKLLPSLKPLREGAGLTQAQLARRAGVSEWTIAKHEQGVVYGISGATLSKLAGALGVDPSALFLPANSELSEKGSAA